MYLEANLSNYTYSSSSFIRIILRFHVGIERDLTILCIRRIYPVMVFVFILMTAVIFQGKQFKALYEKIRNEKYVIILTILILLNSKVVYN